MPQEMVDYALAEMGLPSDWQYRDMPRTTKENYDMVFDLIGEENYKIMTQAKYPHKTEGSVYRSQFFISPQGIENLKNSLPCKVILKPKE